MKKIEISPLEKYYAALEKVMWLADEYTHAVDLEAEDIGGSRPSGVILRELGPAVDKALRLAGKGNKVKKALCSLLS